MPHLIQAADPGCMAYKNTALTAYVDVQAGRDVLRQLLLSLNRETRTADAACGTVRL